MWSRGDTALLRFIRYGKVRRASPHVVIEDSPELVVLHIDAGTPAALAVSDGRPIRGQADRDWALRREVWHSYRVLRLIRWGDAYSLELFWRQGDHSFAGWYVNLQQPLRRSRLGFDTDDLVLDIWIEPDGSWTWKDADELAEAVRLGRFTEAEAEEIRCEGERVVAARPWPTGWEDWRPDAGWELPELPAGWDVV